MSRARRRERGTTLSAFFEWLGAPLRNVRWSWGSVRDEDGAVFLRVWQDGFKDLEGRQVVDVLHTTWEKLSHGYRERAEHVELVKREAPCFMVVCAAADPSESPRVIQSFDIRNLYRGGRVLEREGHAYVEVVAEVPAESARTPLAANE